MYGPFKKYEIRGAANKSNPLPCFVNISTTNWSFCMKIYAASLQFLNIFNHIKTGGRLLHLKSHNFCQISR